MKSILVWLAVQATALAAPALYLNGKIVTLDGQDRIAEAMAIDGGKIVAIGSNDEIRALGGEVIDLAGRTVLPGLIETHCHSIGASRASFGGEYQELYDIAGIQAWIKAEAAKRPPGTWIEVPRNEITRLKERRFPTPEELDAATTDHPVLFVSVTKSVLNSAGWKLLGVVDETSKVTDGEVLFENGRPVLMRGGYAAVRTLMPDPPAPSEEQLRVRLKELHGVYNSVGITSIFERATDRVGFELFRKLNASNELTTRVRGTFRFVAKDAAGVDAYLAKLGIRPGEGDDMVRATCLKITVDGGIHWGTTWLTEPHGEKRTAFYRNTDPSYGGMRNYTPEQMREIFGAVNRQGWPMSAHVTGDGGAMAVLRAVEEVSKEQPSVLDRRFNLIHCYFPSDEMADLAKKLKVGVDTQVYLYYRDADFIAKIYGKSWVDRFVGLNSWQKAGVPVAINSDHMIGFDPDRAMNSFNPFLMLYIAVSRKDDHGNIYGPEQKLSRIEALRGLTTSAAWLSFDEERLGSLEKGKLADFVVIDRDYLTCPEEEIKAIKALRTVVAGRTVFSRE